MNAEERIANIAKKRAILNEEKALQERKKQELKSALVGGIEWISPRIIDLIDIDVAQAMKDNGFPIDNYLADVSAHRLGFYVTKDDGIYIGIRGGGSCGGHLFVNREGFTYEPTDIDDFNYKAQRFIEEFTDFETSFYGYVDIQTLRL